MEAMINVTGPSVESVEAVRGTILAILNVTNPLVNSEVLKVALEALQKSVHVSTTIQDNVFRSEPVASGNQVSGNHAFGSGKE